MSRAMPGSLRACDHRRSVSPSALVLFLAVLPAFLLPAPDWAAVRVLSGTATAGYDRGCTTDCGIPPNFEILPPYCVRDLHDYPSGSCDALGWSYVSWAFGTTLIHASGSTGQGCNGGQADCPDSSPRFYGRGKVDFAVTCSLTVNACCSASVSGGVSGISNGLFFWRRGVPKTMSASQIGFDPPFSIEIALQAVSANDHRILIVSGAPATGENPDEFRNATTPHLWIAAANLTTRGWYPVVRPAYSYDQVISTIGGDSRFEGFYFLGHSTCDRLLKFESGIPGTPRYASPADLMQDLEARDPNIRTRLRNIIINTCGTLDRDWTDAGFESPVMPYRNLTFEPQCGGLFYSLDYWSFAVQGLGGGSYYPMTTCDLQNPPLDQLAATAPGGNRAYRPPDLAQLRATRLHAAPPTHATQALVDRHRAAGANRPEACLGLLLEGPSAYPTLACADTVGPATGGAIRLADTAGNFAVTTFAPPGYADSVISGATLYQDYPGAGAVPDARSIGRILHYTSLLRESVPDSVVVDMIYTEQELQEAGVTEDDLVVLGTTAPDSSGFQPIPATVDTLNNVVSLTMTAPDGIAAIFGMIPTASGPELATAPAALVVAPSPMERGTRIVCNIPDAGTLLLEVIDVSGRRVARVLEREVAAGQMVVDWAGVNDAGRPVAAGVYTVRMTLNGAVRGTARLVRVR